MARRVEPRAKRPMDEETDQRSVSVGEPEAWNRGLTHVPNPVWAWVLPVLPPTVWEDQRAVLYRLRGVDRRCRTCDVPVWQVVERAARTGGEAGQRSATRDIDWMHAPEKGKLGRSEAVHGDNSITERDPGKGETGRGAGADR